MEKVNGKMESFSPIRDEGSRITICYGLKQLNEGLFEWYEIYLPKKQLSQLSLSDVKAAIITDINERITSNIIGGMKLDEKPVWLSIENQINFSQATAPCRLKIGEEEDGSPVYHYFETKTALKAFNDKCLEWKNGCLDAGRTEKENIDWEPYEKLFPQDEPEQSVNE